MLTLTQRLTDKRTPNAQLVLPFELRQKTRLRTVLSTGEEVGRQIISGQSDGSSLLGPLSPRDGLSGVADGFLDQVTRRVAASEK